MSRTRGNLRKKILAVMAAAAVTVSCTGVAAFAQEGASLGDGIPWVDSDLKENISEDLELSPKEDFHLYVNYEWLKDAEIPEGRNNIGAFYTVSMEVQDNQKALLEDESLEGHEAKLVQAYYNAFLNWEERNKQGLDTIIPTVEAIQAIDSMEELSDFICDKEQSFMVEAFINCATMVDLNDSSRYIPDVVCAKFMLDDAAEYAQRTEYGERYYEANRMVLTYLLQKLGFSKEEAVKKIDDLISFEAKLAEVALTKNDMMQPDYLEKVNNIMSLSELEQLAPNFPMRRWMEEKGFDKAEQFVVDEPVYIQRVGELYTEENLEQIKNYLLLKYLVKTISYLDQEAYDINIKASGIINGASGRLEDEEYALRKVSQDLPEPLAVAYLDKYPAEKKKQDITNICQNVIDAYHGIIGGAQWLSAETRQKAEEKLNKISINAVYPEKWYDFSSLSLEGLSYFECQKAISDFSLKREQEHINAEVDRELWEGINILETNAYYNLQDNSINIILGILGGDFYNEEMTLEEMYGGIGAIIAHELSHAFDTNGAQFDGDGNFLNWWTKEDYEAFTQRAQKLAAYYDNIVAFEGLKVSGTNVMSEAIADSTGVQCILSIAKEIEDFDYDAFFRKYAGLWKGISSREFEYLCFTQDVHPLNYLRTNVVLQQFDEFLEEYDIQPGDNMYLAPESRILVW